MSKKDYYKKIKDIILNRAKEYYKNKDFILKRSKEYYINNKESKTI